MIKDAIRFYSKLLLLIIILSSISYVGGYMKGREEFMNKMEVKR